MNPLFNKLGGAVHKPEMTAAGSRMQQLAGEPMNDGYSNARRGEHWVRGHYSRDGRRMYNLDGRYSYRRRDSRGRYSRADGKEDMMESMKEIMADATTEKEREIIRDAMSKLEKA